jgi:hypothetical protein
MVSVRAERCGRVPRFIFLIPSKFVYLVIFTLLYRLNDAPVPRKSRPSLRRLRRLRVPIHA